MTKKTATYIKLKTGEWGLRGLGLVSGAPVAVRLKSGRVDVRRVGRILWTGRDGMTIATTN